MGSKALVSPNVRQYRMGPLNGGISPAETYAGFERVRALLKGSYGTIFTIHHKVKKSKVSNFTWAK